MTTGFGVTTTQITEHAGRLHGIADDVRQAQAAVEGVRVPDDGYGDTGAELARLLDDIADEGNHTLRAAVAALEKAATSLRDTAAEYDRSEDDARRRVRRAGERP